MHAGYSPARVREGALVTAREGLRTVKDRCNLHHAQLAFVACVTSDDRGWLAVDSLCWPRASGTVTTLNFSIVPYPNAHCVSS